jgi:NAD(P)H-flavin reductase
VIDLFLRNLDLWKKPYIYACGPLPMLKALRELMLTRGIKGEFSLESRMGCGMGVCQGCAIQVKDGYKLACKNGPVFPFQEIGEKFYQ